MNHQKKCKCNCGYTCDRQCGLEIMECIEKHYIRDCEHEWDGPIVDIDRGQSVTCSKCGMTAFDHAMRCGI
jgi:hypothetical protein